MKARGGPTPAQRRSSRVGWWLGAGGVAIVVTVALLAGQSNGGQGNTDPEAFDLPALGSEERVQLADFRGKPVVVNLFASWCDACAFELPAFAKASDALRDEVVFVGVNSLETGDGKRMAREFDLAESGFILARDVGGQQNSCLHDALGGRGMPVTAFYDDSGRLIDFAGGALPEEALFEKLRQLYGVDV